MTEQRRTSNSRARRRVRRAGRGRRRRRCRRRVRAAAKKAGPGVGRASGGRGRRWSSSWTDRRSESGHLLATFVPACLCGVRADRLIAVLLLLQTRGRVTVAEVARGARGVRAGRRAATSRRSACAGVPVYSSAGPRRRLVAGRRRADRPLRADRRRGPGPLPGRRSGDGRRRPASRPRCASSWRRCPRRCGREPRRRAPRVVVDAATWGRTPPPEPEHLGALAAGRRSTGGRWCSATPGGPGPPSSRTVSPLGLVTKSGVWYLVAGTDAGVRTFRVGRVTAVTPTDAAGGPAGGLRPGRRVGGELRRGRGAPGAGAGARPGRARRWCRCCGSGWAPG